MITALFDRPLGIGHWNPAGVVMGEADMEDWFNCT